MSLVRPLPHGPWWALALALLVFFGGVVVAGWLGSPWPLVFPVVAIIIFGEWRGLRCPQCRRRLVSRKVPVEGGPAYRLFYECPECEGLWDSNLLFDPSKD